MSDRETKGIKTRIKTSPIRGSSAASRGRQGGNTTPIMTIGRGQQVGRGGLTEGGERDKEVMPPQLPMEVGVLEASLPQLPLIGEAMSMVGGDLVLVQSGEADKFSGILFDAFANDCNRWVAALGSRKPCVA